jgi:TonB family protein
MTYSKSLLLVLALLCFSGVGRADSQQPNAATQAPASLAPDLLVPLALQIKDNAQQIKCDAGKCKIAVTDFLYVGKGVTPFGIQLADLLSAQLSRDGFTIVDRKEIQSLIQRERLSPLNFTSPVVVQTLGSELKAEAIVSGDLAKIDDNNLEFSVRVVRAQGEYKGLSVKGKLHIDLSRVDLSSSGDFNGAPVSYVGLVPTCSYMPNPPYTDEAKRARSSGVVLVEAIVGVDGHLTNMRIVRGLRGLNEVTLKTLETWRCKAPVRDGKPIPVVVNFEVNFKMYY